VAAAHCPDSLACVDGAVGVDGQIDHTQVDAEPPGWLPAAGRLGLRVTFIRKGGFVRHAASLVPGSYPALKDRASALDVG